MIVRVELSIIWLYSVLAGQGGLGVGHGLVIL